MAPRDETETRPISATPDGGGTRGGARDEAAAATVTAAGARVTAGEPASAEHGELPLVAPERYELLGEHARGGLGRILRARDAVLGRELAVKQLLVDSQAGEQRFLREAVITARLAHPGIVPIYEAGRFPTGKAFYTMKMVSGQPLRAAIAEAETLDDRLALVPNIIAVAETLAYAHAEGVIHRDLKPSNVVLGAYGETVVIDWGLAKDLRADDADDVPEGGGAAGTEDAQLTVAGAVIGTPAYMPPEQARGEPVDERADVYALGAMLYSLLARRAPYAGTSSEAILAAVLDEPPPPLEAIARGVPRELATIVATAMARDPDARYQDAGAMAEDLRRFRTGQMVGAHHYSSWDHARRWIARHRALLAVASALLLVLAAVGILSIQRIVDERNRTEQARAASERARAESERRANELVFLQATRALDEDPTETLAWLARYEIPAGRWMDVQQLADGAIRRGVAAHVFRGGPGRGLALSADGTRLATAHADGTALVRDLASGARWRLDDANGAALEAIALAGDEVIASGPGGVYRWHPERGTTERLALAASKYLAVTVGGEDVYVADRDGGVRRWRRGESDAEVLHTHEGGVTTLAAGPDGGVMSGGTNGVVHWRRADGTTRSWNAHDSYVDWLAFSPDGATLATASLDRTLKLWTREGELLRVLAGHEHYITALAFSPDGRTVASASGDKTIRLWNVATGEARILRGHERLVGANLIFRAADSSLISSGLDSTVRVWDLASGDSVTLRGHRDFVKYVAASEDGRVVASLDRAGEARVWRVPARETVLAGHTDRILGAALSADRSLLATASRDATVRVWNLQTGESTVLEGHEGWVYHVAFLGGSHRLISASVDGTVRLWDGDRGVEERAFPPLTGQAYRAFPTPDGRHALVIGERHDEKLWRYDLETGERTLLLEGGGTEYLRVHYFAGGRRAAIILDERILVWDLAGDRLVADRPGATELATAADGGVVAVIDEHRRISLWDIETGETERIAEPGWPVWRVALSGDGRRLISYHANGGIEVRDLGSRAVDIHPRMEIGGFDLASSADGETIAAGNLRGGVRLWDLARGRYRDLGSHDGPISSVFLLGDGDGPRRVVSTGSDGVVRIWPEGELGEPAARDAAPGWLAPWTHAAVGDDNAIETPRSWKPTSDPG